MTLSQVQDLGERMGVVMRGEGARARLWGHPVEQREGGCSLKRDTD